jgi:hypothetical protein
VLVNPLIFPVQERPLGNVHRLNAYDGKGKWSMSRSAERGLMLVLLLVLPLLILSHTYSDTMVGAQQASKYYVQISKVDYPLEVPINSTFQIKVVINYSLPIISGYSTSTSKWLMAALLYNSTGDVQGPSAETFLATSNVDEVSNGGTHVFSLTAKAPSYQTTITFTIYAMYQSVYSFIGSYLLSGAKTGHWSYTHGPNSHVEFSIKVSQEVSVYFATNNLQIPVSIDGYQQYETDNLGRLTVKLAVLRWHLVEIPATVDLGGGTRAVFVSWQDGSNSTVLSLYLRSNTILNATYRTQFLLKVNNNPGSGWYDNGSYVEVDAVSERQARGLIGLIGFKDVFRGWTGDVESNNKTVRILMNDPRQITAEFTVQYGPSAVKVGLIITISALLGIAFYWLVFKRLLKRYHEKHSK